jgi:GntR family transcriptional regulator, phosphonate transport system regulatory protein
MRTKLSTAASQKRAPVSPAAEVNGVTLWRRIADELEQAIMAGTHGSGERLPGEIEIADRFGVNRHTVRRALAELAERGLVRAERGSGTYVESGRLPYPIRSRTRFSEIVGAAGREAGGRLIAHSREPANGDVAARLNLSAGTPVVRLEILRTADGVPICISTNWLEAERMPDAARVYRKTNSMTRTLAHFGVRDYRRQKTRVSAALADAFDAERLRLGPGRPLLVLEGINVTLAGRPVLITLARFAADRVELLVES